MIHNLIPLRDLVLYPGVITPLFVGRNKSIQAIESASKKSMQVVLVSQISADQEQPKSSDVYDVGTLADIVQVMKLPDGTVKLLVEGTRRVRITNYIDDFLTEVEVELLDDCNSIPSSEIEPTRLMLINKFDEYLKIQQKQPKELLNSLSDIVNISTLVDVISSHLKLPVDKKIQILLETDVQARITILISFLEAEVDVYDLEKSIRDRVKSQMDKNHREYYLNEQAKAIQKELEELDETKTEYGELEQSIKESNMPEVIENKCLAEVEKLKKIPSMSSEAGVIRNYIDYMIDYPWQTSSNETQEFIEAKSVLEASHYGLEEVKKRIIEYIAVQMRVNSNGTIICLVGPPGVGKTSIGKSIAKAVNREYVRMALGGMRDEAEIRGHRRTYIGAMPGRIVQNISKSRVNNPLFLLDEIDKMGMDNRGDPASAMLEVLDPEQNKAFNDHFMEVDVDLSQVMFVATANSLDIPEPLLDRMEIIRIPGYTESEKFAIAKQYLIPKCLENHGLDIKELSITDVSLKLMIENYTREAGVRQLDREISKLCRKAVTELAECEAKKVSISKNNLSDYLGVAKFQRLNINDSQGIGRINGLAWTSVGGELLTIEVIVLPGKGKVSLTGKLGDVMKESVEAAMTVVKSYVYCLGVSTKFFQEHDIHIHLPEAATPKDGPSAGSAITVALLSGIMQAPISNTIAMTGEVSLQGRVLAIGGLKEKLFAASREKVKTVFIPQANKKDLNEIPQEILNDIEIIAVFEIDEIISHVFSNKLNLIDKKDYSSMLVGNYINEDVSLFQKH